MNYMSCSFLLPVHSALRRYGSPLRQHNTHKYTTTGKKTNNKFATQKWSKLSSMTARSKNVLLRCIQLQRHDNPTTVPHWANQWRAQQIEVQILIITYTQQILPPHHNNNESLHPCSVCTQFPLDNQKRESRTHRSSQKLMSILLFELCINISGKTVGKWQIDNIHTNDTLNIVI